MKELIGRNCRIHINLNGKDLFYTATILDATGNHLTFSDRHKELYSFRKDFVVEINETRL